MPKPTKYTRDQLYAATKSVRMSYLKKASKGLDGSVLSKSNAFRLIAKKLGLASDRSLCINSDYPYLDKWYSKFRSEAEEAYKLSQDKIIPRSNASQELLTNDEKANYLEIIASLEKRVEVLTIENLDLRTKLNEKENKIPTKEFA